MPKRKRHSVYLTDDEAACVRRAAERRGYKRRGFGTYARESMLFASGWHAYEGPLFVPTNPTGRRNLLPLAMVHDDLRKLHEAARFVRQCFETRDPQAIPDQETLRMLIKRMQALLGYSQIAMLKHAPDALDLTRRLAHNAFEISKTNAIVGNELLEGARRIHELLDPANTKKVKNG